MPSIPSSELTVVENSSGTLPNDPAQTLINVGAAVTGTINLLEYPSSKTNLQTEYTSGPMPEAAGLAMDETGHGPIGTVRSAASTAGTAGAVTKTDPAGAVGTPATLWGALLRAGAASPNGDILYTSKGPVGVSVTHVVAGASMALSIGVVGNAITVNGATDAGSVGTSTAQDVATAILASGPAAALVTAIAQGNGTGLIVAASVATLDNGRVIYTPKVQSVTVRHVVAGASTALSVAVTVNAVVVNLATNASSEPTSTATQVAAAILASAPASALLTAAAGGTGAGLAGFSAIISLVFGSTGAITVSGAPYDNYLVEIFFPLGGALGVAQLRYSLDNGLTFSDLYVTDAGGSFAIPGTNLTLTLTGVFATGDIFRFTCTAPTATLADFAAALDALLLVPDAFALIHLVGEVAVANLAVYLAAIGVYAQNFENIHKYLRIAVEVAPPTVGQTNAQWSAAIALALSGVVQARIGVYGMTADTASSLATPQRARVAVRNSAWPIMARAGAFPVGRDVGDQTYGKSLSAVSNVYQLDQATALAIARVGCFYTLVGVAGIQGQALLLDAPTGDYQYLVYGRVIDEVCRIGYAFQTTLLNSASRRRTVPAGVYPAGSIDPGAAIAIEAFLDKKIREALVLTGQITDIQVVVDRTNTTSVLKITYNVIPQIYFRRIQGKAGIVLSTVQTIG